MCPAAIANLGPAEEPHSGEKEPRTVPFNDERSETEAVYSRSNRCNEQEDARQDGVESHVEDSVLRAVREVNRHAAKRVVGSRD